jgi:hypothetical protein
VVVTCWLPLVATWPDQAPDAWQVLAPVFCELQVRVTGWPALTLDALALIVAEAWPDGVLDPELPLLVDELPPPPPPQAVRIRPMHRARNRWAMDFIRCLG